MGRMYYAVPSQHEDPRTVRRVETDIGTVVVALRPPKAGEWGTYVGLDFSLRDAVREILVDWNPSDEAPGWERVGDNTSRSHAGGRLSHAQRPLTDDTFAVTVLAAFENSVEVWSTVTAEVIGGDSEEPCFYSIHSDDKEEDGNELVILAADKPRLKIRDRVRVRYRTDDDMKRGVLVSVDDGRGVDEHGNCEECGEPQCDGPACTGVPS